MTQQEEDAAWAAVVQDPDRFRVARPTTAEQFDAAWVALRTYARPKTTATKETKTQ